MKIEELLAEPLLEMSYSRKKAESVITGFEKPINDHLLKIMVVENPLIQHWSKELFIWLDEVAEIRFKPNNSLAPSAFIYRILFDEPFGGTEKVNVSRRIRRLAQQDYVIKEFDLDSVVNRLRTFHRNFAEACSRGVEEEQIKLMISNFSK